MLLSNRKESLIDECIVVYDVRLDHVLGVLVRSECGNQIGGTKGCLDTAIFMPLTEISVEEVKTKEGQPDALIAVRLV